ncbi:unnamed protein product [Amoebophrya sp. A120]|nr:unnamed protein product [Amoebophrya sp. A120]CAD7975914.1 unnamed protein product [Amoebophrya sp. A120]|eukprot:GSA120T00026266001.1
MGSPAMVEISNVFGYKHERSSSAILGLLLYKRYIDDILRVRIAKKNSQRQPLANIYPGCHVKNTTAEEEFCGMKATCDGRKIRTMALPKKKGVPEKSNTSQQQRQGIAYGRIVYERMLETSA